MIRTIASNPKTPSRTLGNSRTIGYAAALAVVLALVIPTTEAWGQAGYLSRDPNVSIDMSVLDELGLPMTVAGQHLTSVPIPTRQILFPPSTAPISRLTGPLSLRRFNQVPAPRRQISEQPRSTFTPPSTVTARTPVPAAPAPANVDVRAAQPAKREPPRPAPPVAVPPPARAAVAPAPKAAPKEAVAVAAPPPPKAAPPPPAPEPPAATTASAPSAPAPQAAPKPPAPTAKTPSTAPLTPLPTGPAPPAPVQTAARPDPAGQAPSFRVLFDDKSAQISASAREPLQELSNRMKASEDLRVQLLAYADGTPETASQARRLSLSRALAVRSFLINEGVRSTRMDVRALGNKAESGPADRVDAVLVDR